LTEPAQLPWYEIRVEVETVAMRIARSRFISVKDIVDYIMASENDYPNIRKPREWHPTRKGVTHRAIFNRVNTAISGNKKRNIPGLMWRQWNSGRATNKNGAIFIVPWKDEEPVVVRVREASTKT
jgi:hypothetical protein